MRLIPELLETIALVLPPWALVLVGVAVLAVGIPAWLHWMRTKQIRGALRRLVRARDDADRAEHLARALSLASGRPRRLVFLVEEAIRLGLKPIWRRLLEELEETGAPPADVRRLKEKVEAAPKRGGHPLEEAVIIERMWSEGLEAAARERLDEVRGRFPEDPDLAALEERLASPREAGHAAE